MPKGFLALVALAFMIVLVVEGCGGGSSSSLTTATTAPPTGGKSFLKHTKSKKIVLFGVESSTDERETASKVLSQNLKAREAANFAAQCSSLGASGLEAVLGALKNGLTVQTECAKALRNFAEPLKESESIRTDTLSGPIAALRIDGNKGFALFHGNDGHDFAMPMEKENGEWRVGAIVLIPLR